MSVKHDLERSIFQVLKHNKDGSYATQSDRKYMLFQFAEDLVKLGYKLRDIRGLKEKHIQAVIAHWKDKKLSASTLKNRTSALRYLCTHINKTNIIPSNDKLNIEKRIYITRTNRALHNPNFSRISNPYIRISLELQRVFGLRREESLKIKPWQADKGMYIHLQSSWCKGGREREVPIHNEEQRYWLDQAKQLADHPNSSLIPHGKSYIQQRSVYDKQVIRAGLHNLHGLRHAYAQRRYKELTGWDAPINGGPSSKQLTNEQKQTDHDARMVLTFELGHSRIQIVSSYCSR
jgi:site-specific recombinase XerC